MVAKEPYTARWLNYLNAWDNSLYEDQSTPSYKTNHVSNFIYSTIESMRPVLFDQNPKFEAIPVTSEGMPYSSDITTVLDWEWHRTNMQELLLANSVYTFTTGTSIIMLKYEHSDKPKSEVDGQVTPVKVSPFNVFPDPLATSVEDAEYIIYADYMHVNKLKQKFPDKADALQGAEIQYSELVNERDDNAKLDNQVLVLEVWCRDYSTMEEEVEGEKVKKKSFPKGRILTIAPELSLILEDKENPYDTGRFPLFLFKDIDVPFQFWGEGEIKWLLAPQKQANDLYNQIIDNAKHTANMQWVIDKNAGIPKGQLTNRPGLIIRKNPGSEVRRDSPPSMPMYVQQMIETLKGDMEVISGVHDITRGQTPNGIQSAAAIIALQEAAQIRIRLKVTLHENALGILGTEWLERIRQFWKFNRIVPQKVDESSLLPKMQLNGSEMQPNQTPESNGMQQGGEINHPADAENNIMQNMQLTGAQASYKMLEINPRKQLQHEFCVKIIGSSVMQNSRASMLDQMIRLMQTPAEDGMPCVPREAVLDYLPNANKRLIMQYFQKLKEEQMQLQQQQQMNNESTQQLQMLTQQMQEIGQVVGGMQQKVQQDEQAGQQEQIKAQGYEQGKQEAQVLSQQMDKSGQVDPALLQELAEMTDDELAEILQKHPELEELM